MIVLPPSRYSSNHAHRVTSDILLAWSNQKVLPAALVYLSHPRPTA